MIHSTPIGAFDPNARDYRCLCGKCHVVQGTKKIGIFELIFTLVNFIASIIAARYGSILPLILWLGVIGLLFVAVSKQNHLYLIPHLIMQVLTILFLIVLCMFMIGIIIGSKALAKQMNEDEFSGTEDEKQTAITMVAIVMLLVCLMLSCLHGWFLTVVYHCYKYYKARAEQPLAGHMGLIPQQQSTVVAPNAIQLPMHPNASNMQVISTYSNPPAASWTAQGQEKPPPYEEVQT